MARSTIDESLDTANVCLPGSVGTTMGMGNLDAEADALAANIALSHLPAPPYLKALCNEYYDSTTCRGLQAQT